MNHPTIIPTPPNFANLDWRLTHQDDLDAIVDLAKTCFQVDGGLSFLFEPEMIKDRYFSDGTGKGIGLFMPDGGLAACSSVYIEGHPGNQRAKIVGQVRPDYRNLGIGTYLMRWSLEQAKNLLADVAASPGVMQVATESLTEPAHLLYLAHGFQNVFDELVMECDLSQPLLVHPLPPDITITTWQPHLGDQFFQAYHNSFRERPGFPGYTAEEWIKRVTEDDYIPEWCLLARVGNLPVGFVIGDIDLTTNPHGGYINQVGVVPTHRRRGLASALLAESMRRMQAVGVVAAQLTVHLNNPGAILAYSQLGFNTIGRRARYERSPE